MKRQTTSNQAKETWHKIARFPLTKILIGTGVCGSAMLLTNSLLRLVLRSEANGARSIRWVVSTAALLGAYTVLIKRTEQRDVTELATQHMVRESILGFVTGTTAIALVIAVLYQMRHYKVITVNPGSVLVLTLLFCVTAAALEEIVFRGIIYRVAEESLGTRLALLVSALLFGLIHMPNDHANALSFVSATGGGLLLGLAFTLTRRLWLPIAFHAGWNWALTSFGAVVSGVDDLPTFLEIELQGPETLTGGAFGPENSILTIGLVFALAGLTYYAAWKRGHLIKAPNQNPMIYKP